MTCLIWKIILGCEPTIFIASFDDVDPGTSQIAQNFFMLDQAVVDATLGEVGVSFLDHLQLPDNFILGAQECLDRCKIDRSTFNFTWVNPTVFLCPPSYSNFWIVRASFKDYQIFSNSTWGQPNELPPSVSSMYAPKSTASYKGSLALEANGSGSSGLTFNNNPLRGTVIGLGVTAGALLLAVIGLAVVMVYRGRSGVRTAAPRGILVSDARGYSYATPYDNHDRSSIDKLSH